MTSNIILIVLFTIINSSSSSQGYDSVFSATRCKKLRWEEMKTSGWVFALSGVAMDPQSNPTNRLFWFSHSLMSHCHNICSWLLYHQCNSGKQAIEYNLSLNTGAPKQSTSRQPQGQEGKTSKVRKAFFRDKEVFFLFSNVSWKIIKKVKLWRMGCSTLQGDSCLSKAFSKWEHFVNLIEM